MSEIATPPVETRSAADTLAATTWMGAVSRGNLFAMPVLYRILIANCVLLLVGALLGTALASGIKGPNRSSVLVGFIITGLLLSIVVNFVLLKIAFYPLARLRVTMRRVEAGDLTLRAMISGYDPDADALASAFNHMLDRLDEAARTRSSQILRAQEEERKRIARELHDETSQALTSLLISLALLENTAQEPAARAQISQVRDIAHQTLRAIRNLSIDLRPSALDDLGLLPALRWYIKEYQQKVGIPVAFAAHGFKDRYASEIETALYRIVQEALTNIAKHAKATHITIDLVEEGHQALAHIEDNGRGFEAATLLKTPTNERGLGLVGMRERAALLDGSVEIASTKGQGTTIDVTIPLRGAQPGGERHAAE